MILFISDSAFSMIPVPGRFVKTHQHTKGILLPTIHSSKYEETNADMTPMMFLVLLLADTDGASTTTGGLGVLTTDTETPVVTETTVGADLLEALKVLTDLAVEGVGHNLEVLAIGDVALSVQEPGGDLVLGGVLKDGDDTLELFGGEFTSAV